MAHWDSKAARLIPSRGPEHFKTYSMEAPTSSHWRMATCEEIECREYLAGFVQPVDVSTELGQKQYHFLTHDNERTYSMQRVSMTEFRFVYPPGTPCFRRAMHKTRDGRPSNFLVHDGDWRGNPRGTSPRVHQRPIDWIEDFSLHQSSVAERIKRG
jgi:hypothetical protein